jgi:hypothetical protein
MKYRVWGTDGMIPTGEAGVFGEMPVPVPICPPQLPRGLDLDRTGVFALRGGRLTP